MLPFKGNMDVAAHERTFVELGEDRIPLVMLTATNNSGAGQPISLANIRAVAAVCRKHHTPLYLDACRIAENAYFVKTREEGQAKKSVRQIMHEMCEPADGCTMSAKKNGNAKIGGFLATRNAEVARRGGRGGLPALPHHVGPLPRRAPSLGRASLSCSPPAATRSTSTRRASRLT